MKVEITFTDNSKKIIHLIDEEFEKMLKGLPFNEYLSKTDCLLYFPHSIKCAFYKYEGSKYKHPSNLEQVYTVR